MIKTKFGRSPVLLTVLSILCASGGTQAQNLVANGGFETRNALGSAPKDYFINVRPDPWTITQAPGTSLAFICAPGTADDGSYLSVYPGFPTSSAGGTSTAGGNFLMSDGDPNYSGVISQTISLLDPFQDYYVTFRQAAGQQDTYTGPTTERWSVSLGGSLPQLSPLMSIPQGQFWPWHNVKMFFPAPVTGHTSNVLSFWAVGTPLGMPPIVFLDDIRVTVPEPGSLLLVGIGLFVSVAVRRFRAKSPQGVSDN